MCEIDKIHLRKLNNAYRKGQLVPFVGAGLSVPFGMPGWGTLIYDICNDFNYTISEERKNEINKYIENLQYLKAVEKMKQFGVSEEDLRFSICSAIQQKKKSKKDEPDNIYKDLARMNCTKYLTTNYDNYLSDYIGVASYEITHLYDEFINELDDSIYHNMVYNLHGDYKRPSSIILSEDSYNNLYYDNHEFRKILEHFRERYTLLFIGISLDDKYIQEILEVSKDRLKARHYILLSGILPEKRVRLEKQYNITILEYKSTNGGHTREIRKILNEIMKVDGELENQKQYRQSTNINRIMKANDEFENQKQYYQSTDVNNLHGIMGPRTDNPLIFKEATLLPAEDSAIHEKIKEIIKIQKQGQIDEAISEYNKILQGSISEPLSKNERKLVIKGLLYCYILNRDYKGAESLVETAGKLQKSEEDVDLLSYLIDYYFNIEDYKSAYNIANDWHKAYHNNPLIVALYYYTKIIYEKLPYEHIFNIFLTKEMELNINTTDDNQKQFIYRLAGEIAIFKKNYDDAVYLLRKAYEVDDNIFNIEDLGIATYLKALENADDGTIIKINNINMDWLSKAVEYFELSFVRAKPGGKGGVYSRIAIPYMRSLFYLGKIIEFDNMYNQLIDYCQDDILEIQRMKAINNIWLNKFNKNDVNGLYEKDRILILNEYYNMHEMYDHAMGVLEKVIDKYLDEDEDVLIQFLVTCLNAKETEKFNKYYKVYTAKWSHSNNMGLVKSLYCETNGSYLEAEKEIRKIIKSQPSAGNYNLLISFFNRTHQISNIGRVYEEVINSGQKIIESDIDGFYISYHEYLMKNNNTRKALWLYNNKVKNHVSPDIRQLIQIDLKMRLEDYHELPEISIYLYEKYKDYGDLIHAYNASVAYLHHNEFEKSRYCLNMYKSNGYVDQKSNLAVQRVEERLDILQNRVQMGRYDGVNHLENIAKNTMAASKNINIPRNDPLVIDLIALYILCNINELKRLKHNPEVLIAFKTIEQLHNIYCENGDKLILEIIEFTRNAENVHLRSPSMESVLNNRENKPDINQDYLDSLALAYEKGYSFVKAYDLPIGFYKNKPIMTRTGLNTIKFVK